MAIALKYLLDQGRKGFFWYRSVTLRVIMLVCKIIRVDQEVLWGGLLKEGNGEEAINRIKGEIGDQH